MINFIKNNLSNCFPCIRQFASKLQASSTRNSSRPRRKAQGPKVTDGTFVRKGQVLLTQKGLASKGGLNTSIGQNSNINSAIDGIVKYSRNNKRQRLLEVHPFSKALINFSIPKPLFHHPELFPERAVCNSDAFYIPKQSLITEFNLQMKEEEDRIAIMNKRYHSLEDPQVLLRVTKKNFQRPKGQKKSKWTTSKIKNIEKHKLSQEVNKWKDLNKEQMKGIVVIHK